MGTGCRLVFALSLSFILFSSAVSAQEGEQKAEQDALLMFFTEEELQAVSATRSLKPISHIAENVTVITAAEIERLGAHSLAEVLDTVTGVQVRYTPHTPGNRSVIEVQGAGSQYATIIIDGVVMNQLSNNMTDIGIIPVQFIDRIEVIKGPASSSWGSALGGIINVITKGPPGRGVAGMASVSYGSNNTEDYRAEVRGRKGDLGFYLSAGGIHSSGLVSHTDVMKNNLYSKFKYNVSPDTELRLGLYYLKSDRGLGQFTYSNPLYNEKEDDKNEQFFGTFALTSHITNKLTLDLFGSARRETWNGFYNYYNWGRLYEYKTDERRYSSSGKLTFKQGAHTVVAGIEYDYGLEKAWALINGKQNFTRLGLFVNDTISVGDFSVTPGLRYDDTNLGGDIISPSLGVTYSPTKKTLLRVNVARGYYAPTLIDKYKVEAPNYDIRMAHVWSYQAGVETSELKYVWLKAGLFRHDISDAIDWDENGRSVNIRSQRMQGVEVEMKTMTFLNAWLSAGFMFVDVRRSDEEREVKDVPRYTYDIALNYDDKKSFRASLRGRYVWWNEYPYYRGSYSSFIVGTSASKKIYTYGRHGFEIFAAAQNLFNGKQYFTDIYKNPRRWAEIGVRYKF